MQRTLRAMRLWRFHFSTATATRRPDTNRKLVSCKCKKQHVLLLNYVHIYAYAPVHEFLSPHKCMYMYMYMYKHV